MKFRHLSLIATLVFASALRAAPAPAEVEAYRLEVGERAARWLLAQDLSDPAQALPRIAAELDARPRYHNVYFSLMEDGMRLAVQAAQYGHARRDPKVLQAAATFADMLLLKYETPSGAIVQVDRAAWLTPATVWRTIPWGVPFEGNLTFDAWRELHDEFTPAQRAHWRESLERTGRWIHRNPVVGGYVFNSCIDLCRLLWRLGREFDHPEWTAWALEAAEHRVRRDIDAEGWIQGENGGCSGTYQLIGSRLLAEFAWESRAPFLIEATRRITGRAMIPCAAPNRAWVGNFGTRSSHLSKIPGNLLLIAAAFGEPQAAHLVATQGRPDWEWADDIDPWTDWDGGPELWPAALAAAGTAPAYPPVTRFEGITSTVVREGPWVAYFGNYDRSIWTHGFSALWHAGHEDWVFATLNSLKKLNEAEKAKAAVGTLADWAGFPHVRVTSGDRLFDSHKRIDSLETRQGDGVTVTCSEPLLDDAGQAGGTLRSTYHFKGQEIEMTLELSGLAGESRLDFHFMRRPNGFIRLWAGEEVADILAGQLLRTNGDYQDRVFQAGQEKLFGVQVDRTTFAFETVAVPASATLTLVSETESDLHTSNYGGFRFRIAVPAAEKNHTVKLRLRAVD